ncbi:hypothetical protein S83_052011 [Arachis hypogaea]
MQATNTFEQQTNKGKHTTSGLQGRKSQTNQGSFTRHQIEMEVTREDQQSNAGNQSQNAGQIALEFGAVGMPVLEMALSALDLRGSSTAQGNEAQQNHLELRRRGNTGEAARRVLDCN